MMNKEMRYEKIEQELLMHSVLSQTAIIHSFRKKYDLDKLYPDREVLERMEEAGETEPVPLALLLNTFYTDHSADEYLQQIEEPNCLNQSEMQEVVLKAKSGDMHAREQLMEVNELLIVSIARKYVGYPMRNGRISYLALINIGKDEFRLAIDEYNAETGIRFLPFATWCIHHAIYKCAEYLEHAKAFREETAEACKNRYQTNERRPSEEVLAQLASKYSKDHMEDSPALEIYKREPLKHILEEIKTELYFSVEEENQFASDWKTVHKEKNVIPGSLARLVVEIASEYDCFAEKEGLCIPLIDESNFFSLMEDAGIGLSKALESYEQSKESCFRSYAAWWMHKSIIADILGESTIREIPRYPVMDVMKIQSTYLELEEDHDPTYKELTEKVGIEIEIVKHDLKPYPKLTLEQELQKEYQESLHLNEKEPSTEALQAVKERKEYEVLDLDTLKGGVSGKGDFFAYLKRTTRIPPLKQKEDKELF